MTRSDKRAYVDDLPKQAEDAVEKREQGHLYQITKQICEKYKGNNSTLIKDKNGKLLTTEKEQDERWTEHFKEILNRPPPANGAIIEESAEYLEINIDPPSKVEIVTAIKTLKNRKTPGKDNINAELFKIEPTIAADLLLPLFTSIWEKKTIPKDWTKGTIIKIPKKEHYKTNNWRDITLLSGPGKIMAKLIIQRISKAVDDNLRKEQAGFTKGRGCTDQIFALRNIME